jgi:hypothetical protein
MAPARESGTASAAVGGALWAPATSGLLTPPPLLGAVKLEFEFGAVLPGSAGVADADTAAAAGGAGATGSG